MLQIAAEGCRSVRHFALGKSPVHAILGVLRAPPKLEVPRTIFRNNLFLHEKSWPKATLVQDEDPIFGDAGFASPGGLKVTDYIPANAALVKDTGMEIPMLPEDTVGLFTGLEVKQDIMGNPVTGKPDLGAIEISKVDEHR